MRRRELLLAFTALAAPRALFAQAAGRVYRIAILNDGDERTRASSWDAFRKRLSELGVAEGKGAMFEVRHARGRHEQLPALAAELVALKPDLIVAPGTRASLAAKKATASIPIVSLASGDPTGTGLVQSLARPGGNVTGVSAYTGEILVKQIELLRELVPGIQRVARIADLANPATKAGTPKTEEAARLFSISIRQLDSANPQALEASFATIRTERIQGFIIGSDERSLAQREKIVQFAAQERLPAVYGRHDFMEVGGLMAYEADRQAIYARGAEIVYRVLQGAKPADLPFEQINVIRLSINLKTARALGMKIPQSLLVRADQVIE